MEYALNERFIVIVNPHYHGDTMKLHYWQLCQRMVSNSILKLVLVYR